MVTKYVGPQITEALGITIEDFLNAGNTFSYVINAEGSASERSETI